MKPWSMWRAWTRSGPTASRHSAAHTDESTPPETSTRIWSNAGQHNMVKPAIRPATGQTRHQTSNWSNLTTSNWSNPGSATPTP